MEALKREVEEERQRAREAARERVLLEFEKGQLGLASTPSVTTSGASSKEGELPITLPYPLILMKSCSAWYEAEV